MSVPGKVRVPPAGARIQAGGLCLTAGWGDQYWVEASSSRLPVELTIQKRKEVIEGPWWDLCLVSHMDGWSAGNSMLTQSSRVVS
jgi:hypothetical protein